MCVIFAACSSHLVSPGDLQSLFIEHIEREINRKRNSTLNITITFSPTSKILRLTKVSPSVVEVAALFERIVLTSLCFMALPVYHHIMYQQAEVHNVR